MGAAGGAPRVGRPSWACGHTPASPYTPPPGGSWAWLCGGAHLSVGGDALRRHVEDVVAPLDLYHHRLRVVLGALGPEVVHQSHLVTQLCGVDA